MTFDFTLYPPGDVTALGFTFDAPNEDAARAALRRRLRELGWTDVELSECRVAVMIARKGHA